MVTLASIPRCNMNIHERGKGIKLRFIRNVSEIATKLYKVLRLQKAKRRQ